MASLAGSSLPRAAASGGPSGLPHDDGPLLFDRWARIGLRVPGKGDVILRRFPTDQEWSEHVSRMRFRYTDGPEIFVNSLRNTDWHQVLLDSLADEKPPVFDDAEADWIIEQLVRSERVTMPLDEDHWLVQATVFGQIETTATLRTPSPAAVLSYTRDTTVIDAVGGDTVITADSEEQCRRFDELVISTTGYVNGDVPAFHKAGFALSLYTAVKGLKS